MNYVLDASVAFKWLVPEQDTPKALRLRDDFRQALIRLIVPDFFPSEVIHSLTRAERQGRVTPQEGARLFKDFVATMPSLHPSFPLLARAYALSSATRSSVFDCMYVVLAEQEQCELVSADQRLLNNLQSQFPFIRNLASFP